MRNRSKKMHFRAWLAHQMRNPAHPGAAGNTVNQNRLKPCRRRPFGLCGELESESQNGNPGLVNILSTARRVLTQATLALLALSLFLRPPPPTEASRVKAPTLLAPLLFEHFRPLAPVVQTRPNIQPSGTMAADHARRRLAPLPQSSRAPRLSAWLCALRLRQALTAPRYDDTHFSRAPPKV